MSLVGVQRTHGGPGRDGPARFDFSTTANACGPNPQAVLALRQADRCHYPDPSYHALIRRLAALHRVAPSRVVLAASASEFIFRCTAVSGARAVALPVFGFGDYAAAARAFGKTVARNARAATLVWAADPGSPLGQPQAPEPCAAQALVVLDRACAPLRLAGRSGWPVSALRSVFQLWSPNKALGLTGVRAAYAIAPAASGWTARLQAACPSWPVGADGVALLNAWADARTQAWVASSRLVLARWKQQQVATLAALGFEVLPSVTNFFVLKPPPQAPAGLIERHLHHAGIAWRNTASFGLPDAWRVSVQAPRAQHAMAACLRAALAEVRR